MPFGQPTYYVGWANLATSGGFHPLSKVEACRWGDSHVAILTWSDFPSGIANAASISIGITVPVAGQLWQCDFVRLITPFANAADPTQNSTQIEVGDNIGLNSYVANKEYNLNGSFIPTAGGAGAGNTTVYTAQAFAQYVRFNIGAPGANQSLSNLTQGELRVYFRIRDNNLPG